MTIIWGALVDYLKGSAWLTPKPEKSNILDSLPKPTFAKFLHNLWYFDSQTIEKSYLQKMKILQLNCIDTNTCLEWPRRQQPLKTIRWWQN